MLVGEVGHQAVVREKAVLGSRDGVVGERIAAGIVVDLVPPHERIDRQQHMVVERMLIPGSDHPRHDALFLVLRQLLVGVRNLKPVSRHEQVQVVGILPVGLPVDPVENGRVVAPAVEGGELRGVGEAAAVNAR